MNIYVRTIKIQFKPGGEWFTAIQIQEAESIIIIYRNAIVEPHCIDITNLKFAFNVNRTIAEVYSHEFVKHGVDTNG